MDFYIYVTSETIKGLEKKVNDKHKEGYIKSSPLVLGSLSLGNQIREFYIQPTQLKEEKQ